MDINGAAGLVAEEAAGPGWVGAIVVWERAASRLSSFFSSQYVNRGTYDADYQRCASRAQQHAMALDNAVSSIR